MPEVGQPEKQADAETMRCPVCQVPLMLSERQGIEIDYCPKCRGVWLDRGELDKIIERSERENLVARQPGLGEVAGDSSPAATGFLPQSPAAWSNHALARDPQAGHPAYPPQGATGYYGEPGYGGHDFDRHGGGHGGGHSGGHGGGIGRGGFLSRLFR